MTVTKHVNLLLLFILIVSVGYCCVVGKKEVLNTKAESKMRKYLMGFDSTMFESRKFYNGDEKDCMAQECDPSLDHCEEGNICGKCHPNSNIQRGYSCSDLPGLPPPSKNCDDEFCVDETDKECFDVGCFGGCDIASIQCKFSSESESESQPESESTTTEQKGTQAK